MELVPTEHEVIELLRQSGALRQGHFEYPNGLHSDQYLHMPLAMRYYQHAKILSVALSRLLRADHEIRAVIPELSIVAPATGGLPIAYGICEALRARQVYWAEQDTCAQRLRFHRYLDRVPGEKVIIVDDILRIGTKLAELTCLVQGSGAQIMGMAVLVHEPTPATPDFGALPLFSLARLDTTYYNGTTSCDLCMRGLPVEKVCT